MEMFCCQAFERSDLQFGFQIFILSTILETISSIDLLTPSSLGEWRVPSSLAPPSGILHCFSSSLQPLAISPRACFSDLLSLYQHSLVLISNAMTLHYHLYSGDFQGCFLGLASLNSTHLNVCVTSSLVYLITSETFLKLDSWYPLPPDTCFSYTPPHFNRWQ